MSNSTVDESAVRAAGLTLVGEPLAIDLANTEKLAVSPAKDLIESDEAYRAFWALEAGRVGLPDVLPDPGSVRELRSAIRSLLESRLAKRTPEDWAIDSVNRAVAAAPSTPQLSADWTARTSPSSSDSATALLATFARSAVDLVTGRDADRLHRCAAEDCSMLFVATNAKRQWCTAAGCGNRQRVARHASRQRRSDFAASSEKGSSL